MSEKQLPTSIADEQADNPEDLVKKKPKQKKKLTPTRRVKPSSKHLKDWQEQQAKSPLDSQPARNSSKRSTRKKSSASAPKKQPEPELEQEEGRNALLPYIDTLDPDVFLLEV